jgi:hypothetical protein
LKKIYSPIIIMGFREVPGMATFLVSIFVVVIVGAAAAFAYVLYLGDDGGRTGP